MKKIKSTGTSPEISLGKEIWKRGYRYRKHYKKIPGKPDFVFVKGRVAVFIDGEFWHGFNWEEKKQKIKSNRDYWLPKIERNIKRDKENNKSLKKMGWVVIRFWEKEVKKDLIGCADIIERILSKG